MATEAARPRPAVGDRASIEIDDLESDGTGVGPWPSSAGEWSVRVADALPGERVRVEIEHVSRAHTIAFGRTLTRERSLEARTSPLCRHHPERGGACGGCPLMGVDVTTQRALLRERLARRHGLVLDEIRGGEPLGYRMSSKRVVGGRPGSLVLGSYRRRSHEVASMRECLVDHPHIVACFAELEDAAAELRIEPFDERTGEGDLRYAWAKTDGEEVLLTLVTAGESSRAATELAPQLTAASGIAWSVQAARTNAIRGDAPRILRGAGTLHMRMAGVDVAVGPLGFLQPNPAIAARAYEDLLVDAEDRPVTGRLAFDLYAGAGVVTRRLRTQFEIVRACERYPESARGLGIEALDVAEFLTRSDVVGSAPRLVVANPPRAGMGFAVCAALSQLEPEHITIMSCNAASLVRDLADLADRYALVRVRGYETLPQTTHLELVAWLQRRPNSASERPNAD